MDSFRFGFQGTDEADSAVDGITERQNDAAAPTTTLAAELAQEDVAGSAGGVSIMDEEATEDWQPTNDPLSDGAALLTAHGGATDGFLTNPTIIDERSWIESQTLVVGEPTALHSAIGFVADTDPAAASRLAQSILYGVATAISGRRILDAAQESGGKTPNISTTKISGTNLDVAGRGASGRAKPTIPISVNLAETGAGTAHLDLASAPGAAIPHPASIQDTAGTGESLINTLGGPNGFGVNSFGPSDDGSTAAIDITSIFEGGLDLFGTIYDQIYINNNGNITFSSALRTYTPSSIGTGYTSPIIAPFWADVDTRGGATTPTGGNSTGSDLVWYDLNAATKTLTVTWDDVGYFNAHADKADAFQLQLIGLGSGNFQIQFRYQNISWTTGDLSGGQNGLGGTPAREGYSAGDGVHYYELPGSGDQTSDLNLATSLGNTGQAGLWVFNVSSGTITNPASATINTASPIDFGVLRVGAVASQALSISNTAPAPAEGLDVAIGPLSGSATGSGSISVLAAGETNTTNVTLGLDTSVAGMLTGSVTFQLSSDGANTDGLGITALPSQTVQVVGKVYRLAAPSVAALPRNLVVHVGDSGSLALAISNTAASDGFSENLAVTGAVASGDFSATAPTVEIAPRDAANVSLGFSTASSGALSGSVTVNFASDGMGIDGFGPTAIESQTVALTAAVDNYAAEALSATRGTLAFAGTNYTLDLGTALEDGASLSTDIALVNSATGLADLLSGNLALESDSGFANTGPGGASGLGAGQSATLESISLSTATAGTFSETFVIHAAGSNASGYNGAFQDRTLTVTGTVQNRPAADLVVSSIAPPAQAIQGQQALVSWTLTNQGDATATGPWQDDVYIASDAEGDNPQLVGTFAFNAALDAGASVTRTEIVNVPRGLTGSAWFVVQADATNATNPHPGLNNHESIASTATTLTPQPFPDLVVSEVTPPSSAFSGQQTEISWVVTNNGGGATSAGYWSDNIYLSLDRTLDTSDILLTSEPNPTYLASGESYQSSAMVTLPQGIAGPYYIIVKTNADNQVDEGQDRTDSVTASSPFPVVLSPAPNLHVTDVFTPSQEFSGQTARVTWTTTNTGAGTTDVGAWYDTVYLSQDGMLDSSSTILATVDHNGALAPNQSYTASATVTLPAEVSGNYTLFVVADSGTQVYELGDATSHSGSAPLQINLTPPPDLTVTGLTLPTGTITGHSLDIAYSVSNVGSTTTPNVAWNDSYYISRDNTLDSRAVLLGSSGHYGALDVGQSYSATAQFTLPDTLSGQYYVIVQTDSENSVFELDNSNNVSVGNPIAVAFNPVNLVVSEVNAPSTGTAGHQLQLSWQVTDTGSGDTSNDTWTDKVILSASGVVGASDNIVLATVANPKSLSVNGSYTDSASVDLPTDLSGGYTLFVATDTANTVPESDTADNVSAGQSLAVTPLPELQAASVSGPTTNTAGDQVSVSWAVSNIGAAPTGAGSWFDNVYMSTSSNLGGGLAFLGQVQHAGDLAAGGSYTASGTFTLPATLQTGQYYFVIDTDSQHRVQQVTTANDVAGSAADSVTQLPTGSPGLGGKTPAPLPGTPIPGTPGTTGVPIVLPPPSDLSISGVTAPSEVLSGQPLTVSWTLSDAQNATPSIWYDEVYLSRDQVLDSSAIALGSLQHSASLASGASQTFTDSFTVPNGLSGPYYVFVTADASDSLNDPNRDNNTANSSVLQVDLAKSIDLTVGAVSVASSGGDATVTYTVNNLGDIPSQGSWEDAVYLSNDEVWNVNDPLLGYVQHSGGIVGNGSYSETLTTTLPGLVTGNYYAIVKTDVLNNQPESDKTNNTGVSTDTISASLPVLNFGTPATGVLSGAGGIAYYQFTVAAGETVDLSMTSDNASTANDIYVRYGAIPTIGQFDATSTVPASQDPSTVIQESQPGTYYVLVRESAGGQEDYTLSANKVGYSITGITPDQGSNLGSVTLTIKGAKFNANEQVEIIAPDGTVRKADKIAWVDSGELWATFDLTGLAVGGYNVEVQDATQSATLTDGFTVTNGPVGHLSVSLVAPATLRTHVDPSTGLTGTQHGVVTIQYTNDGGTDIAAPIFDLQATNAEFQAGVTGLVGPAEITILGTSQTGPAGILQPGAQEIVSYSFVGNFGYAQFISMQLSLGTLQGSDAAIDWGSLEDSVRPASIDSTDWNLIWSRFETQVGNTTQSLLNALSQAATTLSQIGQGTSDLGTLLSYELEQASGTLPDTTLTAVTDLADTGTGIDLSLTRTYSASLLDRNNIGTFGEGWTFTYDISAVTDSLGNVAIRSPAGTEFFTLQSGGGFTAQSGDDSTLTVVNGLYVLTNASGVVERFRTDGKIGSVTDTNGNVVTVAYDGNGVISGVTSSNGQSLSFTTNAAGEITSATDAAGQTVTYAYDATNTQLVSVSSPTGVTNYSYDSSGNPFTQNALTQITNPDGTHQYFQYDSQGNLSSQSADNGVGQISYAYDGPGVVTETDANGNKSILIYDANGNVAQVEDAAGDASKLQYDANGNLTGVIAPDGATYKFNYDTKGDLTSYTDPLAGTVSATYQPGTQLLTSFTDQDGNTTRYSYDAAGDLTDVTYDNGSGVSSQYSANGALTETTDARGQTIQYGYNASGELTSKTYSDDTTENYTYDAQGDLLTAQAQDGGVTHYTYNAAGELTSVTDPQGRVESYGYDSAGREIQRVEPDGSISNYSYNAAGQLAELQDGTGNLLVKYSYDTAGQLIRSDMGNGASTLYSYDASGNVTQILTRAADGSTTSYLDYTYDSSNRPVTVTSQDGAWIYSYDASGELTHAVFASTNASVANQNLTYEYDAAGNRTKTIFNGAVTNYATNGLNQYTSANGTTYSYDADGNLITKTQAGQSWNYSYDSENQLISETGPDGKTSYQYDALGNRVSQTANGVTSDYVIDPLAILTPGAGPLSAVGQVYNANGNVTATYEYGNGLVAGIINSTAVYYNADSVGNITSVSGEGGSILNSYDYTPFGVTFYSTGPLNNPFQYSGIYGNPTDINNNNIFMHDRTYDPTTGRFISRDPLGVAIESNSYNYALNSPLQYVDPTGAFLAILIPIVFSVGGGFASWAASRAAGNPTDQQFGSFVGGAVGGPVLYFTKNPILAQWAGFTAKNGAIALFDYANNLEFKVEETEKDAVATLIASVLPPFGKLLPQYDSLATRAFTNYLSGLWKNVSGTTLSKILASKLPDAIGGQLLSSLIDAIVKGVKSVDPNDVIGPTGYGAQAFIAKSAADAYTINFENAVTASAPAQQVVVTQQLDSNLDWRTFRLTGFGFDNQTTTLSGNSPFYGGLIDDSATKGYDVEVTAGVNVATGLVTWTFQTVDPTTGQAPTNPQLGFLPIDDTAADGEGFVSYTVKAKSTVQTGATVSAQATVVFDTNAPLNTPTVINTIDGVAPTSAVAALPSQTQDTSFDVSWSGTDDAAGSGIASYTITVSDNHAAPTVWLANTTRTNAIFTGQLGHSYAFSSVATDNAGNVEAPHAAADAIIFVSQMLAPPPVLSGGGNSVYYTPGAAGVPIDAGLGVSDAGDAVLAEATVAIVGGRLAGDALTFDAQNGIIGSYDASSGILTLTGSASPADYQAALQSVTFASTDGNPSNSGMNLTRTISWRVTDGVSSSNPIVSTIIVGTATIVTSGQTQYVSSGQDVSGVVVSDGGRQIVSAGGMAIGTTIDSGGTEIVYSGGVARDASVLSGGELFVSGGSVGGLTISDGAALSDGIDFAVTGDSITTVVGSGEDFEGSGQENIFVRLASDQLAFWQLSGAGELTSGLALTVNGAPLTIDAGTSVIGGGEDFLGSGDRDVFVRLSSGQLIFWEFDNSGRLTNGVAFTVDGAPLTIDSGTSVVGSGDNFRGSGDKDVFVRLSSGQLISWQFDTSGALTNGLALTVGGNPLTIDTGTSVVGGGEDFLGAGQKDLFVRLSSGQLIFWQFDASGGLTNGIAFTVNGAPLTIDTGTSVVGGGEDFAGSGDRDVFLRTASGQLIQWQFDPSGQFAGGLGFTANGAPLTIDTATSVVGGGEDFFGSGGKDVFLRTASGQLILWQFDSSGQFTGGLGLTANGAPLTIDTATSVIGGGEDLLSTGSKDVFLRTASGQLILWQFDGSGQFTGGLGLAVNGAPLNIDTGTSVVGGGEDLLASGGKDVFLRTASGQLILWQFDGSGQFTYGIAFTANGGAFTIDSATTVIGAGHDSANGDMALQLQYGNGQTALFDLIGSALTPAPSGGVLNAQAFGMSEIAAPKTAIDTLNSGTGSLARIGATPDLPSSLDGTLARLIQAMASSTAGGAPLDLAGATLAANDPALRYALAAHH